MISKFISYERIIQSSIIQCETLAVHKFFFSIMINTKRNLLCPNQGPRTVRFDGDDNERRRAHLFMRSRTTR